MIGPKNKILGKDFLKITIDYLVKESEFYGSLEEKKSSFEITHLSKINDSFLKKKPCVNYNDEDFFITKINLTDKPIRNTIVKTYKYNWEFCDKSSYQKDCCSDNDPNSEDSEDSDSEDLILCYSLDILNRKNITYKGSYLSQPMSYTSTSGGQYNWTMGFIYIQDDISIYLELGAKRIINEKYIYGHTGTNLDTQLIREELYKVVYNYKPSDLFFEDDFYSILKIPEFSRNYTFIYKDKKYKVIDYKFCNTVRDDRYCGCCLSYCNHMNEEDGFNKIKLKSSYRLHFTISCTPEWYIQLQIGSCCDYNLTARFILEFIF